MRSKMDYQKIPSVLEKAEKIVEDNTKHPEAFLTPQDDVANKFTQVTKLLYDSIPSKDINVLPELLTENFDYEQVFQQLELLNESQLGSFKVGKIAQTLMDIKASKLPLSPTRPDDSPVNSEAEDDQVLKDDNDEEDFDNKSDEDENDKHDDFDKEDSDSDEESNDENLNSENIAANPKKRKKSEVDDTFFKLDQLDEFLRNEDQKEYKKNKKSTESSDEDDIGSIDMDLFKAADDEDGADIKYNDFFDNPESDEEDEPDKKKVRFDLGNEVDDNEGDEEDEEDGGFEDKDVEMDDDQSTLEIKQERLKKKIKHLEEAAISEKPWQLQGQVTAHSRPENSLLETYVEFDAGSRPPLITTQETNISIEDIIIQRIKDKAWDDVVKKYKTIETPVEFKKKLVMNQEKSKESLAQIYENEYIKQREALNPEDPEERQEEEPKEHIELKERMHALIKKLDALCNYHYTPKVAKPEVKIISNVPAVSMEEVAPVATTDATLLAPEEVRAKEKSAPLGETEKTKTDKKRERRKKKRKQHAHAVRAEKKAAQGHVSKSIKDLKGRNIVHAENDKNYEKPIKSSTAFFAKLQDQTTNAINLKTKSSAKKTKPVLSANKLKL
ncbi:unnamed protein product [Trichogramma brassicae]|uniref:U3 small nucleolar ribonucleoprotein protein MPP10 n=1 Tax=Trichogramma brassicae TaxID=86971 RepID=A0A6H5IJ89_9HYME|nr:unnamed protein product [Trichogramma brassicae]